MSNSTLNNPIADITKGIVHESDRNDETLVGGDVAGEGDVPRETSEIDVERTGGKDETRPDPTRS